MPFPRPKTPSVAQVRVTPAATPGRFRIECLLEWEAHTGQKLTNLKVEYCNDLPTSSAERLDAETECKPPGTSTGHTVVFEAASAQLGRFRFRLTGQNIKGEGTGEFVEAMILPSSTCSPQVPHRSGNSPPCTTNLAADSDLVSDAHSLATQPQAQPRPKVQEDATQEDHIPKPEPGPQKPSPQTPANAACHTPLSSASAPMLSSTPSSQESAPGFAAAPPPREAAPCSYVGKLQHILDIYFAVSRVSDF